MESSFPFEPNTDVNTTLNENQDLLFFVIIWMLKAAHCVQ
jgi:hypothetical protein